jgi:SAM-dependent methyltransferase
MYKNIHCCRLCKSEDINSVIEFGDVPLANAYPTSATEIEQTFPLTVVKCRYCGHVQLKETIDPKVLFSNYLYASSDSPSLITHFRNYAKDVLTQLNGWGDFYQILEIGSNDGILLKEFAKLGVVQLFGVEPATNIAEKSRQAPELKLATIYNDFFDHDFAKRVKTDKGTMDLICANNVFAHVAELDSVMAGVVELLHDDGVFVFENAYLLDTIKGLYFDQVYHEHLQYYGIKPLIKYLGNNGLEIFDIKRVNTQGGSFRIFTQKKTGQRIIQQSVLDFVQAENDFHLYKDATYEDFVAKIEALRKDLSHVITTAQASGRTISCYGCPAKFALFSKFFGLDSSTIKYVVDDSPLKQGRFSPGKKIPIVGREHFLQNPTDFCIVSVWNMADAVISRNPEYKGIWVKPMPDVVLVTP